MEPATLIDMLQAQNRLGCRNSTLFKLIDIVTEDTPLVWNRVIEAASKHELRKSAEALHELRGLVANFGTTEFVESIDHWETRARHGEGPSDLQLHRLDNQIRQFLAELIAWRGNLAPPGAGHDAH